MSLGHKITNVHGVKTPVTKTAHWSYSIFLGHALWLVIGRNKMYE